MSILSDLRTLAVNDGFRKLFAVRLVSQCGDGMFQIGLATLFFFSPERMATAGSVAAAFAVLLLPFTVVGPFAGPLLDRWRRRQVLAYGNAVRVVLTVVLALLMVTVGVGPVVYVLALVTLGVNRFLLAALSAGLPRVVPREHLLMANALTPTLGAVSAVVGAGVGLLIGWFAPASRVEDGVVLATAAAFFAVASGLALRLRPGQLGPGSQPAAGLWVQLRATAAEMVDGARYLVARRTPGLALGVMAVHRFLYGMNFIALLLISRNLLNSPADAGAGLASFALLTGVSFAGNGLAIVLTPLAYTRMHASTWVVVCLAAAGLSQALLTTAPARGVLVVSAVLLGVGVQGAKIAVDTIVQRDTDDSFRGRAFALYDVLYNAAFVAAAALAAVALPDTGWSRAAFVVLTAVYLVTAAVYRSATTRRGDRPAPVLAAEHP
ncbi:MFS transporter [Georgenia sp. TF02-10]|uniref:MFS transporter n=1 Tax=Georgenia sp. TF02-10 TaxID=2917725 RepID=UPI001FA7BEC0|nr:MFS transporter [Georgenia sp. TF02-10]UNX54951.1 MFS transporter [Georgenia sp. TF02-10]